MAKIIRDGFHFMEYANSRLLKHVNDVPELKNELISKSALISHQAIAQYGILLANSLASMSIGIDVDMIILCKQTLQAWIDKQLTVRQCLDVAGSFNQKARESSSKIITKSYRLLGQLAAIPHVRWHSLVASEYQIVLINLLYPNDIEAVRMMRQKQISWLTQCTQL